MKKNADNVFGALSTRFKRRANPTATPRGRNDETPVIVTQILEQAKLLKNQVLYDPPPCLCNEKSWIVYACCQLLLIVNYQYEDGVRDDDESEVRHVAIADIFRCLPLKNATMRIVTMAGSEDISALEKRVHELRRLPAFMDEFARFREVLTRIAITYVEKMPWDARYTVIADALAHGIAIIVNHCQTLKCVHGRLHTSYKEYWAVETWFTSAYEALEELLQQAE